MRHWYAPRWLALGLTALGLLALAACSGSASETPWPVEPVEGEQGPAGEALTRGNVIDTSKLPDNYSKDGDRVAQDAWRSLHAWSP